MTATYNQAEHTITHSSIGSLLVADRGCPKIRELLAEALVPVLWLEAGQQPLETVTAALETRRQQGRPVQTLHWVSHGQPGVLQVGAGEITRQTLVRHRADLGLAHAAGPLQAPERLRSVRAADQGLRYGRGPAAGRRELRVRGHLQRDHRIPRRLEADRFPPTPPGISWNRVRALRTAKQRTWWVGERRAGGRRVFGDECEQPMAQLRLRKERRADGGAELAGGRDGPLEDGRGAHVQRVARVRQQQQGYP